MRDGKIENLGSVFQIAFSPDGESLAIASAGGVIANSRTGAISKLEGHDASVFTIAFNPDGSRLATGAGW